MSAAPPRPDHAALNDRMGHLLLLRAAMAVMVVVWAGLRPEALGIPFFEVAAVSVGYLGLAFVAELVRARTDRFSYWLVTVPLLTDGLYLAFAMYATGGTQSPFRFLVYLQLVAVSLLASYRTGLKMALWDSLLLFVGLYAQAARLVPAVDVVPGAAIEFDRMPVLNVTAFWLFALATSIFSALNERELRQRRGDLQALVDIGARLDEVGDPMAQSEIVLDGLLDRFAFSRGVLLGASDDLVVVLAARTEAGVPTEAMRPDHVVDRAWQRREVLAVGRLDPVRNPGLSALLPGARNVIVAPMIADGRPAGAIVVEHRARRIPGVERRVASMVSQVASIAALNLRNAALLRHVRDLAERDSLTGAANRRTFQLALEETLGLDLPQTEDEAVTAVLFIDLDDFKVVNDTLGHAAGDALLVAVTERITGLVRESDLVARLGGDEFAILTMDEPDLRRSRAMADRLVRELRLPYAIGGRQVVVTSSVGIASARDALADPGDLVRNADVAMYMAKANGKSGFAIFDPGMHEAIRERHELSAELGQAVERDQLRLAYQPIVDLATGAIAGVEALVRWQHPTRGLIMPTRFIEIAEENGTILPIGRWVLRRACRDAARWLADGRAPDRVFVGVNVSAREIQGIGFVDGVRETLAETGLGSRHLVLEITETALLRATPATIATLEALRELGVRTVIDDFGTGYFSLSHLRQFPVDVLKIASEFVQDDEVASKTAALAGAIVALGRSMGIETVAEGIETPEQARRMRALGCTYGQGYWFGRPVGDPELVAALEADRAASVARSAATPTEAAAPADAGDPVPVAKRRSRSAPGPTAAATVPASRRAARAPRAPRVDPAPA